jgi:serine/threonine-protein kinase
VIDRDDWKALDAVLDAALDRPDSDRAAFLDEALAEKPELRARAAELLLLARDDDPRFRAGGGQRGPLWEEVAERMEADGRAALPPGTALGRYVIRDLIGTGGMGRVYRALDPALERDVAVKALVQDFRDDAASLRRFEREARLLATLNHPNVGAIYGFELIDGAPYLILELVPGETLANRLERGPLGVGDALAVAVQIAEALSEAHRNGVVHRDLKPANVKLTESGRVKVLDFGVAKPVAGLSDETETASGAADPTTTPGTLVGTAPYMSPEQVRGQAVDARSDIWAFGCLLYEMLTGRRAFPGTSSPDVLAAVLRDDVDFTLLPADTPAGVRRLLRLCLQKDPRDRLQAAGDARLELTEAAMEEPAFVAPSRPWLGRYIPHALAAVGLAASAALVALLLRGPVLWQSPGLPAAGVRLSLDLPPDLTLADDYAAPFALSPDGGQVALVARRRDTAELFLRRLDDTAVTPVPGTAGAWQPVFAPDGKGLAFFADRKLKRVSLDGGSVQVLADIGGNPRGASWGEGGAIVVAPSQTAGLFRVDDRGGELRPLTTIDEAGDEHSHRWPQVLPGGRHVLFTVSLEDSSYDDARLEVASLATGERRRVLDHAAHGRYAGDGRLVFARGGRLLAVSFDLATLSVRGEPELVIEGVRYNPQNGGTHMAVSGGGTLVYAPGAPTSPDRTLTFVDFAGRVTKVTDFPRPFREPRVSPDGRRVAAVVGGPGEGDLFVLDLSSGTLSQITFGASPHRPIWTRDGEALVFGTAAPGAFRLAMVRMEAGALPQTVMESKHRVRPSAWSADGRVLVYEERVPGAGWDILMADVGPGGDATNMRPLVATPFNEQNATVSRDGRLLAYEADELDGVFEIYVRPLMDGAAKV